MRRYHNLSAEELQTIRKFIEESDAIDATSPAELQEIGDACLVALALAPGEANTLHGALGKRAPAEADAPERSYIFLHSFIPAIAFLASASEPN